MDGNLSFECTVRSLEVNDFDPILNIIKENLRSVNSLYYSDDVIEKIVSQYTHDKMFEFFQEEARTVLVAVNLDRVLGTATLLGNDIRMVYVDRGLHGKNVGKTLIYRIELLAKSRGVMQLTVDSSQNATGFYEKLGFQKGSEKRKNTFCGCVTIIEYSKKIM